jgi:gamma-glutamyl phosphate reductase
MLKRLELSESKIFHLASGIRAIASQQEPLGRILRRTQVADGLELKQITSSLGVFLVIFESRPDALPQIAALAVRSGCGVLLKGGKEAKQSNSCLHSIVTSSLKPDISPQLVSLVETREHIEELLKMDQYIDLVVPRGGNSLVQHIKRNTSLPVLGHSDGVCHVVIDGDCDYSMAKRIAVDSKCDYPAACNALETLVLLRGTLERSDAARADGYDSVADGLIAALHNGGVKLYGSEIAFQELKNLDGIASSLSMEYGDRECSVVLADTVDEAIQFIHQHGSAHTDSIVTCNEQSKSRFLKLLDSACVFHNASTRFSDGFRFGLGAEVRSSFLKPLMRMIIRC